MEKPESEIQENNTGEQTCDEKEDESDQEI